MARISKFLFDTDFGERPSPAPAAGEPEDDEVAVPTFSEDELQAAREHGYESGVAAGSAQALAGVESRIEALIEELRGRLETLADQVARQRQAAIADVVTLAKAIAAKVAGEQTAEQSLELIETLARECLASLYQASEATIRVGPDLAPALEARLGALALPVAVKVAADSAFTGADCRIEWQSGGARRIESEIWTRIDDVLTRYAEAAPAAEQGIGNNSSGDDHG
jgi:flagellar biosynthesis/type III secretory pathway protein FliH